MKQLESGFKITFNWKKYQPALKTLPQNRYLNYLIDPSFQEVNRLFVLPFENETGIEVHTKYYIPNVEIKECNVIVDGRNFFDQPIKNDLETNDNIRKIATGQGDDYTTGCLLDYIYLKEHCMLLAKDLSKQQKLDLKNWSKSNTTNLFYWKSRKKMHQYFLLLKNRQKQF